MKPQIIAQAAEAIIYKKDNLVIKDRISKSYRIKELDEKLRKSRTKSEIKLLQKASKIINVPLPLTDNSKNYQIIIPFINGKKLSDNLDLFPLQKQKQILNQIGQDVAKLHNADIIHGDLTTSNMILVENNSPASQKNKLFVNNPLNNKQLQENYALTKLSRKIMAKPDFEQHQSASPSDFAISPQKFERSYEADSECIFFIDFGLSFISPKIEDKAVDLHLLKQALEAKHFKNWEVLFKAFLNGYSKAKNYKETLERLKKVEIRGRYKG